MIERLSWEESGNSHADIGKVSQSPMCEYRNSRSEQGNRQRDVECYQLNERTRQLLCESAHQLWAYLSSSNNV